MRATGGNRLERLLRVFRSSDRRSGKTVVECRRCGTTRERRDGACEHCGSTRVAVFHIE